MPDKNQKYFLSPHVFIYQLEFNGDLTFAIHHSLLNHCYFFNKSEWEMIQKFILEGDPSNLSYIDTFKNEHIVVPQGYNFKELNNFIIKNTDCINCSSIGIIYVSFNTLCNLSCDYCFIINNFSKNYTPKSSSNEEIKQIKSWLTSFLNSDDPRIEKKIKIIGYGGEPLLSWKNFDSLFSELSRMVPKHRELQFEIVTNGTILNDDVINFLKRHRVQLAVSIDGPRHIHDIHRKTQDNLGSFDLIYENLKKLGFHEIPFGISTTITDDNRKELENIVTQFNQTFAISSIGFNLLLYAGNDSPTGKPTIDNYALQKAYVVSKSVGVYEDRIGRKVTAFNNKGELYFKDCGAFGNQIVITPNGDIKPCQAYFGNDLNLIGNIKTSSPAEVLNSETLSRWSHITPIRRENCQLCPAIGICGNGCAFDSEMRSGSPESINHQFCFHTIQTLEFLLKESYIEKIEKRPMKLDDINAIGIQERGFQYRDLYERR